MRRFPSVPAEPSVPDFRRLSILYEDASVAVVYKPAGLLSVSYPGSTAKTALDVLCDLMRKRGRVSARVRPAVVHRLDRDTSGVMVFALTAQAKALLMDDWNRLVTERRYRALAENPSGKIALGDRGVIDSPLSYNAQHRAYVAKGAGRRENEAVSAVTRYSVVRRGSRYTLFELELETGRKNQIRAHLASEGFVIAGDGSYRAKSDPFGRLCLHARTLAFTQPLTGESLRFEIPEPPEWEKFCR